MIIDHSGKSLSPIASIAPAPSTMTHQNHDIPFTGNVNRYKAGATREVTPEVDGNSEQAGITRKQGSCDVDMSSASMEGKNGDIIQKRARDDHTSGVSPGVGSAPEGRKGRRGLAMPMSRL